MTSFPKLIAIIDDQAAQLSLLSSLVSAWSAHSKIPVKIKTFPSAEAFLFDYAENKTYDLALIDIQMEGMDGVSLAKELRRQSSFIAMVFITGTSEYMQEGYDVAALHYLLKPVNEEKLHGCLTKSLAVTTVAKTPMLCTSADGEALRIIQESILYIEAKAHNTIIQTLSAKHEVRSSFSELEKQLSHSLFVKCHRSYIAGLGYISKIGKSGLTMENGAVLPISRSLFKLVNNKFVGYYAATGE